MTKIVEEKIRCVNCGQEFSIRLYDSINVTLDPGLREKIKRREINVFPCPECGTIHKISKPFLYNDMERRVMVSVNPGAERSEKKEILSDLKEKLKPVRFFLGADSYDFDVVFSLEELERKYLDGQKGRELQELEKPMRENIKSLSGKAMILMTKKILEKTEMVKRRLLHTPLENFKLSDLSDFRIMGLPEATAIAIMDWYYCNEANGIDREENFRKIVTIRQCLTPPFIGRATKKRLARILEKQSQSLIEFIGAIVKAEHKIDLSKESIKELILEYKELRGTEVRIKK